MSASTQSAVGRQRALFVLFLGTEAELVDLLQGKGTVNRFCFLHAGGFHNARRARENVPWSQTENHENIRRSTTG